MTSEYRERKIRELINQWNSCSIEIDAFEEKMRCLLIPETHRCDVIGFEDGKIIRVPAKSPTQELCLLAMSYGERGIKMLMYTCGLPHDILHPELMILIERGLVVQTANKPPQSGDCPHQLFALTDKGREYIECWRSRDWISFPMSTVRAANCSDYKIVTSSGELK